MIALQRILFPTDFSEASLAAARHARALTEEFGAELHLLHILEIHVSSTPTFGGGLAVASTIKESQAAATAALKETAQVHFPDLDRIVLESRDGPAFVEILRYAKEHDMDLIVMGTHGRSGLAQAFMGSVAERVVRKSSCPVLTVKPEGHEFVMP